MSTLRNKNRDPTRFDRSPGRGRRGETLVECIVAVALVAAVAIPALAALRAAFAGASEASSRAVSASAERFRARSESALARFEADDSSDTSAAGAFPDRLPPLRVSGE